MGQMGPMHSKWFDARCTVVPPPEWELQSVREMETLEVQLLPKNCCWQGIASNPQPAGTCDHSDTSQPRPAFAGFVPSVRCGLLGCLSQSGVAAH